jgi:hypothetical protein
MTNTQYGILLFLGALACVAFSVLVQTVLDLTNIKNENAQLITNTRLAQILPTLASTIPFTPFFTNSAQPKPSKSKTKLFTLTPLSPTFTSEPSFTLTPYPTLPKGPFIVYVSGQLLKILIPDGSGIRNVLLPGTLLPGPISPDGRYMVLIEKGKPFPGDAFYLMNISKQIITPIPIAPSEEFYFYYGEEVNLYFHPWSPDGKYLVIIGEEKDAPEKVFLYEVTPGRVVPVSIDLPIIEGFSWSPDGQHLGIVNREETMAEFPLTEITIVHLENAAGDITASAIMTDECYSPRGWLSSSEYLYTAGGCQISPAYGPISIQIHTTTVRYVWHDYTDDWAIDPVRKILYVHGGTWDESSGPEKWKYFISSFGGTNRIDISSKIIDEPNSFLMRYRGGAKYPFMYLRYTTDTYAESIYGITRNGNFTLLSERTGILESVSPVRRMLAVYNTEGIDIFDEKDILLRQFQIRNIQSVYWMDQQERLYFVTDDTLYLWKYSEALPKPIYKIPVDEECCRHIRWVE